MQCDSIGDIVLGAMSLMMNSSTTITTLSLPCKCTHTHTLMCTKNITASQPTHTHIRSNNTTPQPLQHLATYIWCWRVQGLGVGPGQPAPSRQWGSVHVACDVFDWQSSFALLIILKSMPPSSIRCIQIFTRSYPITWTHTHHASDSGADLYISCIWSGFMASWPLAHPAACSIS